MKVPIYKIKKEFVQEYFLNEPYNEYVNGCGISKLRMNQRNLVLRAGESLEDFCLSVTLRKEPPEDLEFPSEYKGVRVFYKVVGEIRLL